MMNKPEKKAPPTTAPAKRQAKKPYHKPVFMCDEVFETSALACGKAQSTQRQCHNNRKFS